MSGQRRIYAAAATRERKNDDFMSKRKKLVFITSAFLVVCVAVSAVFYINNPGKQLEKALKKDNFKVVQVSGSYVVTDLNAEKESSSSKTGSTASDTDKTKSDSTNGSAGSASQPSNSSGSGYINYGQSAENGSDQNTDEGFSSVLEYKRYNGTEYISDFGSAAYYYSENGKYYRIISRPDYENPEDFQYLWYKQEVDKDTLENNRTFNYDAFSKLKPENFHRSGSTFTLDSEYVNSFIKDLLKLDMSQKKYNKPSVKLKISDDKVSELKIEFYYGKKFRYNIDYTFVYNNLKIILPECTDKPLLF